MYAYKKEKEKIETGSVIHSTPTDSANQQIPAFPPNSLAPPLHWTTQSIISFYVLDRDKIITRACGPFRKLYQVPQGKSLLLGPFPCRTHERPLVVLQLLHSFSASARFTSPA
jgi:hypothetical protein